MPVTFNPKTGKPYNLPELSFQLFKAYDLLKVYLQTVKGYKRRSLIVDRMYEIKDRANKLYIEAIEKAEGR